MKNRTIIGIICIIVAVIISFVIAPLINNVTSGAVSTVRLNQDVKQGSVITETMLEEIEINKDALSKDSISEKSHIVGKFAASNLYSGDVITKAKLTEDGNTADDVFSSLDGSNVAISVTVDSLASGLSGKLQNGDIISFIITRNDTNQATTPPQLRYMKVVTTTTADGIDKNEIIKNDDGSFELPSTITVLANNEQAKLLAEYEGTTNIHVALVYRGDKDTANKFLNIQNDYFKTSGGATNE